MEIAGLAAVAAQSTAQKELLRFMTHALGISLAACGGNPPARALAIQGLRERLAQLRGELLTLGPQPGLPPDAARAADDALRSTIDEWTQRIGSVLGEFDG